MRLITSTWSDFAAHATKLQGSVQPSAWLGSSSSPIVELYAFAPFGIVTLTGNSTGLYDNFTSTWASGTILAQRLVL